MVKFMPSNTLSVDNMVSANNNNQVTVIFNNSIRYQLNAGYTSVITVWVSYRHISVKEGLKVNNI